MYKNCKKKVHIGIAVSFLSFNKHLSKKIMTIRYLEHISLHVTALKGQHIITHGEAMRAVKIIMKTALKGRDSLSPFQGCSPVIFNEGLYLR